MNKNQNSSHNEMKKANEIKVKQKLASLKFKSINRIKIAV